MVLRVSSSSLIGRAGRGVMSGTGVVVALALGLYAPAASHARPGAAPRVAGGVGTAATTAPWQAWVQTTNPTGDYYCGGAILDSLHVVTAAHCLYDGGGAPFSAAQISVTVGISAFSPATWLAQPQGGDHEQDAHAASFRAHPGYVYSPAPSTDAAQADDVAVIALSSPLDLSGPAAAAIPLAASMSRPATGSTATVTGFGSQGAGPGVGDGHLHQLSETIIDAATTTDESNALWVVGQGQGSTCVGDSGDPLVADSPPRLVGIASHAHGPACAAGDDNLFVNIGAPEIQSFLAGDAAPPQAPRGGADADESTDRYGQPGATLTCSPGTWSASPAFTFQFQDRVSGQVLQTSSSATYTASAADVGRDVLCRVLATTPGGIGEAPARHYVAIAPPEPAPVPPSLPAADPFAPFQLRLILANGKARAHHPARFGVLVTNESGTTQSAVRVCVRYPAVAHLVAIFDKGARQSAQRTLCWAVGAMKPFQTTTVRYKVSLPASTPRLPQAQTLTVASSADAQTSMTWNTKVVK